MPRTVIAAPLSAGRGVLGKALRIFYALRGSMTFFRLPDFRFPFSAFCFLLSVKAECLQDL